MGSKGVGWHEIGVRVRDVRARELPGTDGTFVCDADGTHNPELESVTAPPGPHCRGTRMHVR